jgi:hypothetical protein
MVKKSTGKDLFRSDFTVFVCPDSDTYYIIL